MGSGRGVEAAVGVAGAAAAAGAPPPDWQPPARTDAAIETAADNLRAPGIERDFLTAAREDDDLSGQPYPADALVPEAEEVRMKDFGKRLERLDEPRARPVEQAVAVGEIDAA